MRFSDHFGIVPGGDDDWFDLFLSTDTELFVDPFLIYADRDNRWTDAHDNLVAFFNLVLSLIAKAPNDQSAHWKAAQRLLLFPEPAEFCLGYGETPLGSGSGRGLQQGVLEGAVATVRAGIDAVEHFEELTLFEAGIGADRIGDIACNVLKAYFIEYTQEVAKRHGIPCEAIRVPHAAWSESFVRWEDAVVELPLNPFTERAVLLTPSRFLRKLPNIEPEDFWDWSWSNANEELRGQFNYDLGKNVDGRVIASMARRNPALTKAYVKQREQDPKPPYDLDGDPSGDASWYDAGSQLATYVAAPEPPASPDDFCNWVQTVLEAFAHDVEHNSWFLLWVGDRPRSEKYVQRLFRTACWQICRERDVDLSGEPEAGRGPVDFKFSKGWLRRALAEIKLTNNSGFWNGIESQTVIYLEAEQIQCGYFVSVGFRDVDFTEARMKRVRDAARTVSDDTGLTIMPIFVDARKKASASKKQARGSR